MSNGSQRSGYWIATDITAQKEGEERMEDAGKQREETALARRNEEVEDLLVSERLEFVDAVGRRVLRTVSWRLYFACRA